MVTGKLGTRRRVQWCYGMFMATQDGLVKSASVHSIHGFLLAVGELLSNTVLQMPAERVSEFIALGKMARALDGDLIHYVPTTTS